MCSVFILQPLEETPIPPVVAPIETGSKTLSLPVGLPSCSSRGEDPLSCRPHRGLLFDNRFIAGGVMDRLISRFDINSNDIARKINWSSFNFRSATASYVLLDLGLRKSWTIGIVPLCVARSTYFQAILQVVYRVSIFMLIHLCS